ANAPAAWSSCCGELAVEWRPRHAVADWATAAPPDKMVSNVVVADAPYRAHMITRPSATPAQTAKPLNVTRRDITPFNSRSHHMATLTESPVVGGGRPGIARFHEGFRLDKFQEATRGSTTSQNRATSLRSASICRIRSQFMLYHVTCDRRS